MVKRNDSPAAAIPESEVSRILADTARAVKVMKASWLRVALNLKKIRKHELWRVTSPPCSSYEDYAYGVLKLNRAVERRMLSAMEYTEERRPRFIEEFEEHGGDVEVPSYEVVNQLRRVEEDFKERPDELKSLESMVYEDGAGRVVLKREIDERLGRKDDGGGAAEKSAADTLEAVIRDLMAIESRLRPLKASKAATKLCFELIELLQKDARGRPTGAAKDGEPVAAEAAGAKTPSGSEDPPW
jgi:hypothetical protein